MLAFIPLPLFLCLLPSARFMAPHARPLGGGWGFPWAPDNPWPDPDTSVIEDDSKAAARLRRAGPVESGVSDRGAVGECFP